jgi:deazaflavin-dependent oxidoreductase (nitroreductase family)
VSYLAAVEDRANPGPLRLGRPSWGRSSSHPELPRQQLPSLPRRDSVTLMDASPRHQSDDQLGPVERFWRNRLFARIRHRLTGLRRSSPAFTRAHAALIRLSRGRIRRSFLFTGGMPILVLTTTGRKSGQRRSTPVGYLKHGDAFAVLASNAGNDRSPAWWLNLQADPGAEVLAEGARIPVTAGRGRRRDGEGAVGRVRAAPSRLRRVPQPDRAPDTGGPA